ncbi:tumor necrosis factor receptor superfamily member 11A-like isoform X2 [Acanthaster planci]|uniref:Tumor necrosis factor receptor superfamily member 11A-like isoform X2 n=1 Tax=Acanthaster planci TaxID=133434 RepID=A0A8B7Z3W2_ACAPL|nr:tumor necrosis factor receptor superfamily member 11A-like isoform X2 [Acanthaster planci]
MLMKFSGSAQLRCRYGMFDDRQRGAEDGKLNCRPCSRCLPGYQASRLCSWSDDTECSPCLPGYYSASTSSVDACLPCRTCGQHQPVLHACNASADTICSRHCSAGYFYSPLDDDCLPCSPCQNHPLYQERMEECIASGMGTDMQCWPLPTLIMGSQESQSDTIGESDNKSPSTTVASQSDYHKRPAASSPRPRKLCKDDSDLDRDTRQVYVVVLLVVLVVGGLCAVLSVTIIICLCRFTKMVSRSPKRTGKSGYENISRKTSELLVRQPTYV